MRKPRAAHTQRIELRDRILIQTDARRAEAAILVLSGCSLQEVGDRLKVTRERIRQYLCDLGLSVEMRQRFGDGGTRMAVFMRGSPLARRSRRKARLRARYECAAAFIRDFATREGRGPTYQELAVGLGGPSTNARSAPWLLSHFGKGRIYHRNEVRRIWLAYRMAGIRPPLRGAPGHRDGGVQSANNLRQWWAQFSPQEVAERMAKVRGLRGLARIGMTYKLQG